MCVDEERTEGVWGVGIHSDVTQASMVALLSAASSVSLEMGMDRAVGRIRG